ncbi:hypothetical protein [Ramlibacter rhizophilus]|uniref:Uncharacterized protein n=1 Tax=Ramlibacter rhizophilus TaxID=1781167 RepID=A0A4Z0BFE6_9BURK|nr:hypothetical protein [Ramlibacter rhizophilus]TFY96854.1 hypothetical protein EZ242_19465 [Ramlibacter rhizophilus]
MRAALCAVFLAAAALAGCDRGADTGATANPVAPGRPGEGNPPVSVVPLVPGGASPNVSPGVGGTPPSPQGVTGSGSADPAISTIPGVAPTAGALDPTPSPMATDSATGRTVLPYGGTTAPPGAAPPGSPNSTPSGAVGQR